MRVRLDQQSNVVRTADKIASPKGHEVSGMAVGGMFGAQCKVSISYEGKRLSAQLQRPTARSSQTDDIGRMMLRQEEQTKRYEDQRAKIAEEVRDIEQVVLRQEEQSQIGGDEYSQKVSDVKAMINQVKEAGAKEYVDTIEEKQEVLRTMNEQKKMQEEENKQRLQEAESAAALSTKQQEEVDRDNADLFVMLKSIEEQEESEENRNGDGEDQEEQHDSEKENAGSRIRQSASQMKASAVGREMLVSDKLDGLEDAGMGKLSMVNELLNQSLGELNYADAILRDETYTEKDRQQLADAYVTMAGNRFVEDGKSDNYQYILKMKQKGMQERQDARDLGLQHIGINPLSGVNRVQNAMMDMAVDAVRGEAAQGVVEDASKELADRVQEELDKRNDTTPEQEEKLEEERREQEKLENEEQEKFEEERREQEKLENVEQEKLEQEKLEQEQENE